MQHSINSSIRINNSIQQECRSNFHLSELRRLEESGPINCEARLLPQHQEQQHHPDKTKGWMLYKALVRMPFKT